MQGDKHLAIGVCPKHGDFAVQLKVGKYTIKSGSTKFYVTKVLTHCTDEIRSLYTQKSEINREKERKYLEFRRAELKGTAKIILLIPVHIYSFLIISLWAFRKDRLWNANMHGIITTMPLWKRYMP